ncbi:MAG: BREX-1 system phosphatase PglZ type A, partial [Bacteroidota bacterium]
LQEIIIPLIKIIKKKQNTVSQVGIDIIKSTDRITTNILAVSFIQSDLVSEQVLPRTLRAGIYADDGELLSDLFKYNFDITEGSERQREVKHRFQLSAKASNKYKNQRVRLILEEPVEGSNKWKAYKDYFYTLNISFTNDFDDF